MTCPLQSNVSSKIMTAGNCRSTTTMYEYENGNSELRQSMQHDSATEQFIEQCKCHRTIVRAVLLQSSPATEAHIKFCVALELLLQSMFVV